MSIQKINNVEGALEQTGFAEEPLKKESKAKAFLKTLGSVGGLAAGVMFPGVGGIVGNIISGKSAGNSFNFGGGSMLGPESSQFLQFQQQMTQEMRAFELASTLLKNRHDASMSAIRNMKS